MATLCSVPAKEVHVGEEGPSIGPNVSLFSACEGCGTVTVEGSNTCIRKSQLAG